jgi:hypothetical protein
MGVRKHLLHQLSDLAPIRARERGAAPELDERQHQRGQHQPHM